MKHSIQWMPMLLAVCAMGAASTVQAAGATTQRPGAVVGHGVEGPFFPAKRPAARGEASTGDTLKAQAESRLKANFDAADTARTGALTKEQAQQNGLGYVANNFDKIDARKSGKVTFEDVKQYLQSQPQPQPQQ